ncbi:hypothetical protein ACFY12_32915 [Streptomyces sp. NPDC001339]|uniref:hypothetical protein n=1 Tax=Streptomyces sp. NPDC001339 TaxID=3364563 RepID=UPI00367CC000
MALVRTVPVLAALTGESKPAPKHGKGFRFAKPDTWGEPDAETMQVTDRYGTARTMAWDRTASTCG